MAVLQYDFRVVGMNTVQKALSSIERRVAQHNAKIARLTGTTSKSPRRDSPVARAQKESRRVGQVVVAEEQRTQRKIEQIQERRHKRRVRRAIQASRRISREEIKAAKAAQVARQRFARGVGSRIGGATSNAIGAVGRFGAGALSIGGGFALAGAVQNQLGVEKAAAALANQAYREGQGGPSREQIAEGVTKQARDLGASSGLGAEGIIQGLRNMTAISGRLDIGQALAPFLADITDATDADIGDVGRTAGQVVQALAARGLETNDIIQQTTEILAAMGGQAKVGSIEFADLAQNMGALVSSTARFDGKASDLVTTMGAVAQLAIAGAATSPEEAMTAILRFSDDLITNAKNAQQLERGGVGVFTDEKRTKLRAPEQILFDVLEKSGGDLTKIKSVFGIRAQKAVAPFQTLYTEKGGGEAGLSAVRELLDSVRDTTISTKEIKESAEFRRQQADKKFSMAVEDFNAAIGEKLLPAITELIPKFVEFIPLLERGAKAVGDFLQEFADNPLRGIGKIIAAKIVLDLATAGIGAAARAAITGGLGSLTGAGGGTSFGGGKTGAVKGGLAGGFAAAVGIFVAGVANFEAATLDMIAEGKRLNKVRETEDPELARQQVQEQRKRVADLEKPGYVESFADIFLPKDMAQSFAELTTARDPVEIETAKATLSEMEAQMNKLEMSARLIEKASMTFDRFGQNLAASPLNNAALNRGNSPSPVKG